MSRRVDRIGVIIPARHDGENAQRLVTAVLRSADEVADIVTVILADDGENGHFGTGLPDDPRLLVATTTEHGPGYARAAGVRLFAEQTREFREEHCWVISLDADVTIPDDFLTSWLGQITTSSAELLTAPAHFGSVNGEPLLTDDVNAASAWMWSDTTFYERFVGVVNLGGSNHAISLACYNAVGGYLQPTAELEGRQVLVAGDDWDFGLRARLRGYAIERVEAPLVIASTRRIAADPVGFLSGRTYEGIFAPVPTDGASEPWPPSEPWNSVVTRGRARIFAHFLLKPLLAGLKPLGAIEWFVGRELSDELAAILDRSPVLDIDWNEFRTTLIGMIFGDDVFSFCRRAAAQLTGGEQR